MASFSAYRDEAQAASSVYAPAPSPSAFASKTAGQPTTPRLIADCGLRSVACRVAGSCSPLNARPRISRTDRGGCLGWQRQGAEDDPDTSPIHRLHARQRQASTPARIVNRKSRVESGEQARLQFETGNIDLERIEIAAPP